MRTAGSRILIIARQKHAEEQITGEDCAFVMYRIYLRKKNFFYKHKQLFIIN